MKRQKIREQERDRLLREIEAIPPLFPKINEGRCELVTAALGLIDGFDPPWWMRLTLKNGVQLLGAPQRGVIDNLMMLHSHEASACVFETSIEAVEVVPPLPEPKKAAVRKPR